MLPVDGIRLPRRRKRRRGKGHAQCCREMFHLPVQILYHFANTMWQGRPGLAVNPQTSHHHAYSLAALFDSMPPLYAFARGELICELPLVWIHIPESRLVQGLVYGPVGDRRRDFHPVEMIPVGITIPPSE